MFCCSNCDSFIKKCNSIIKKQDSQIIVQGTHHLDYPNTALEGDIFKKLNDDLKKGIQAHFEYSEVDPRFEKYKLKIDIMIRRFEKEFQLIKLPKAIIFAPPKNEEDVGRPRHGARSPSPSR